MAYTKFLHVFGTKQEHDTARSYGEGGEYHEPWVAYVNDSSKLVTYNRGWAEKYLTFEAIESGTFRFSNSGLSYSIDEGKTWTEIARNTATPINAGDRIMFKGVLNFITGGKEGLPMGVGTFSSTNSFNAMGNPYSLLYGDNFVGVSDLTGKNSALESLFRNCQGLISAKNVALPATTLATSAYTYMFYGCTSLTTAPELPATTLVDICYYGMFQGCTSLTTAPTLPATTLASNCYGRMFSGCTSLTAAPELPATTLARLCYYNMFNGCASLTEAPELPATTLAEQCYADMFNGCTALTAAPELPATTLAQNCYGRMFKGCTSLTAAPELPATILAEKCYENMFDSCTSLTIELGLPATTLADYCYNSMFADCTSLAEAPELPATTLASSCYSYMFYGCTSLTTAPELPAKTLINGCYGSMFRGCTSLNYIKAMFTTTPSSTYTYNWVNGVASTGTFVKNSAAGWDVTGNDGVPTGWTVETASA